MNITPLYITSAAVANEWIHYTNKNFINCIAINGNELWAGTGVGLVKWNIDSATYEVYMQSDGLANNNVQKLAFDYDGNLWASFILGGVGKYDGDDWTIYSKTIGNAPIGYASDIAVANNNTIWFAQTGDGVSVFNGSSWTNFTIDQTKNFAFAIGFDNSEVPWIFAFPGSLIKFDGIGWISYDLTSVFYRKMAFGIDFGAENNIWLATNIGVIKYDGTNAVRLTQSSGLLNDVVTDLIIDDEDNKWFATQSGISKLNDNTWQSYREQDGLSEGVVTCLELDAEDNLWAGTHGGGINKFDGELWNSLQTDDWLPDNDIRLLAVDRGNILWIGTPNGICSFNGTESIIYTEEEGLTSDLGHCIAIDKNDNKWVGYGDNSYGVDMFDGTEWRNFTREDGLSSNKVYAIAVDKPGNVWFATSFGVTRYDGDEWLTYTSNDGLVNNELRSVAVDNEGNIWFGTQYGISKFTGEEWENFTIADGLPSKTAFFIMVDSEGKIWVGFDEITESSNSIEIAKFDGNDWHSYFPFDEFLNTLTFLKFDLAGNLWAGSSWGAKKYDGTNWISFTSAEGLIYDGVKSFAQDSSGNLWFGTANGLSMLKSSLPTSIKDIEEYTNPSQYVLSNNYPNPFNPITTIRYQLAKPSETTISIYNILGQEVRKLMHDNKPTGIHEITWDGTNAAGQPVSSGIYIYRLTTDNGFADVKKMLLMK